MIPLTLCVHGESGVGKSWLGDTSPAPRLVLDAEGGVKFTPSNKSYWAPGKEKPPSTKETCVVTVKDFATLGQVYNVLASGQHPFKSVVLDSLTEMQKRCIDGVAGTEAVKMAEWGEILRKMEGLVRDLTMTNGNSLHNVTLICGSNMKDGVIRPHVQGQLGLTLPYFLDVVGYLHVGMTEDGQVGRKLLVTPVNGFTAKDRTGRLGFEVQNPNITEMWKLLQEESK